MKLFVIGGPTVEDTDPAYAEQRKLLRETMATIGREIAVRGHTLLVCSPFEGSADVDAIRGAATSTMAGQAAIELHHPSGPQIAAAARDLRGSVAPLRIDSILHPPPANENDKEGRKHAWLLAQLAALEASHIVIAVGGRSNGPMSFLLPLAESQRRKILPLAFLGGAAGDCFERQRYVLADRLGAALSDLGDVAAVDRILEHVDTLCRANPVLAKPGHTPKYFISYAKARPAEADFIETLLRRRECEVFRDERDFGAGQNVLQEIHSHIERADVFIAVWCREYACSPWCFDELELALERQKKQASAIWLFCVDDTRIVPRGARNLLNYRIHSREELEGQILKLLQK